MTQMDVELRLLAALAERARGGTVTVATTDLHAMIEEAARARHELAECWRTRALGGPPPPVDKNWANADVGRPASADDPNAPAHRRDRNGGEPG